MRKIRILADSTCDLSEELIRKFHITILPLYITMDGCNYKDGIEITPQEIYRWSDRTGKVPKTAAVGMDTAQDIMGAMDEEDTDLILFGISQSMSSTCNVFRLVGENLNHARTFVIDSQSLSTGIGLQVIRAAEFAAAGMNAETITRKIEEEREKVRASFVVDNLIYLERGGRCSSVTTLLANTLKIRPEIVVENGRMNVKRKFHGKMDGVIEKYVESLAPELKKAAKENVFITHSGCPKEWVNKVYCYLESLDYFQQIYITTAGGVISSHCGPNTLGVLFYDR